VSRRGRGRDEFAVGGRRVVAEAIRAGRARRVLVGVGARRTQGLEAIVAQSEVAGVPVEQVSRDRIDALGLEGHQGVAALVTPPAELSERELSSAGLEPDALVVVLDGIEDPQNLGACARSAEAAGASILVCRRARAAPVTPAAVRASAGALFHLPVARVPNLTRAIERLRDRGFFVVGLDQRADRDIHGSSAPPRPLAIVVGSEGTGLSRLVRETCDELVAIPMPGRTGSLNASAALAVALFGYALRSPQ